MFTRDSDSGSGTRFSWRTVASCKYRYFIMKRKTIYEKNGGAVLVIGICNTIRRKKMCLVEKQQQREEKPINQKVVGSAQGVEPYLTTTSNEVLEKIL